MQLDAKSPLDRSSETLFVVVAVVGALAVALGAFGAHGLKGFLETAADGPQRLQWWTTAAHYHLVHALLAAVFALLSSRSSKARTGIGLCCVGVLLFSGSLYAMTLTNVKVLGAVTPLGGLAFIAAWLWLAPTARASTTTAG